MQSIILIGMPGAGKSTVGVLLAKALGMDFVDTDIEIQKHAGKTLQTILDDSGYLALRKIEEQVLLNLDANNKVISTGGSAVYSEPAMAYLKTHGMVVFLQIPPSEVRRRVRNFDTRGIARAPQQSLEALFAERDELYRKYAAYTVRCRGKRPESIVDIIVAQYQRYLNQQTSNRSQPDSK